MYKELFEEAISAIKNHPFIEIKELQVNNPATPELIDISEMTAGIRLPGKIKDLYLFANGIKCTWSVKQNLPQEVLDKIRDEGEQFDFDYSKPLGSVKILAIEEMLLNKYWVPPFQKPPELNQEMEFAGHRLTQGAFTKKLKLFDAYEVNNESEGVALVTDVPVQGEAFHLLLLDNYLAFWKESNLIDFETYITVICKTRFTIPGRKRLFGKKFTNPVAVISKENIGKDQLTPALFK